MTGDGRQKETAYFPLTIGRPSHPTCSQAVALTVELALVEPYARHWQRVTLAPEATVKARGALASAPSAASASSVA